MDDALGQYQPVMQLKFNLLQKQYNLYLYFLQAWNGIYICLGIKLSPMPGTHKKAAYKPP